MTVTATYVNASAKVTVAITSAPTNAETVLIERSTDGVTWTTVRGASVLTLTSGAVSIDDYEFSDAVANTYRATYTDTTTPSIIAAGTVTTTTSAGSTASVTPPLPTGLATGDIVFALCDCTNIAGTVTTTTTGWTVVSSSTKLVMATATWAAGLAAPVFAGTGLASGNILVARTYAVNRVSPTLATSVGQSNAASTSIAYPAVAAAGSGFGLTAAFMRGTNTATTPAAAFNSTAASWSLLVFPLSVSVAAGVVTVTGGSSATSEALGVFFAAQAFVSQETGNVTPAMTTAWIKNPVRPYLNRAVMPIDVGSMMRPARSATFDVIARELPVGVTDVFGGRKSTLTLRTADVQTMTDLENCVLTGETQFVQAPKGARTPTGYFVLGDLGRSYPASTSPVRYLGFALTEVAAPSPILAAALSSYQTVLSTYATYQALATAKATYADVLLLVGSPSDIITG